MKAESTIDIDGIIKACKATAKLMYGKELNISIGGGDRAAVGLACPLVPRANVGVLGAVCSAREAQRA